MRRIDRLFIFALLAFILSLSNPAHSKTSKDKFVPKTGIERKTIMMAPVAKEIYINRDITQEALTRLASIENLTFIVDTGGFPPKSLLVRLAKLDRPVRLVLPNTFTSAHTRRLSVLAEYGVLFRISGSTMTEEVANRVLALGPRRKTFEVDLQELTPKTLKLLSKVGPFDLRIRLSSTRTLSRTDLGMLSRLKVMKELLVPADYPPKMIQRLGRFSQTRILLHTQGVGPNQDQVKVLNKLRKVECGAIVRGLIKSREAFNYLMLDNLRVLYIYPEDWTVTQQFVEMMNSRGAI